MWWKDWGVGPAQHRAPPWASPSTRGVASDQLLRCSESPSRISERELGVPWQQRSLRGGGAQGPSAPLGPPAAGVRATHPAPFVFLMSPMTLLRPPGGTGTASGGSTNSANGKSAHGPHAEHGGASSDGALVAARPADAKATADPARPLAPAPGRAPRGRHGPGWAAVSPSPRGWREQT